jgi:phytanoyl-CoA hydroxylase
LFAESTTLYKLACSRYFLEEDAVDENGKLTREKQKAVNKIGHGVVQYYLHRYTVSHYGFLLSALHELDPVFRRVTSENDKLKKLVRDLKFHRDPVGES